MNKAKQILIPRPGVFRTTFLYTGQGEATLMTIPNGQGFIYILIDTNNDKKNGGIDVKAMLADLLETNDKLYFINTHPHDDHLRGIKAIHEKVKVREVWHSGHKPGRDYDEPYQEMMAVIKDIGKENEFVLFGTNAENKVRKSDKETEVIKKLGDVDYIVLSPAEYVSDDIEGEDAETRYNRIHEQCAVMKFSYGGRHIMITGDSDKKAWEEHITDYHEDKLDADVLSSSHHGSRTFFKNSEDDENVYEKHIENITPIYLIISSPKQSESKHGHPHDDAMDLYKKHVDEENIHHLGKNRESVIVDITKDGKLEVKFDQELVEEYGFKPDDEGGGGVKKAAPYIGSRTTRLDEQKMG